MELSKSHLLFCSRHSASDTFISKVSSDPALIRKFFKTDKKLNERKIRLGELFDYTDHAVDKFKDRFTNCSWHRLRSVAAMFAATLNVKFANNDELDNAICVRHDIAHRNGKTSDWKQHQINQDDIEKLANTVEAFVHNIEDQLNPSPF